MRRLRQLGIRIALDDFGTGYSSLSYLHQLSFDTVKIDRSFIVAMANPRMATVLNAIVALAVNLGARVTAEGVETPEQLDFVRHVGCTEVQGFLFSPPLPAHDVAGLIASDQARLAA